MVNVVILLVAIYRAPQDHCQQKCNRKFITADDYQTGAALGFQIDGTKKFFVSRK